MKKINVLIGIFLFAVNMCTAQTRNIQVHQLQTKSWINTLCLVNTVLFKSNDNLAVHLYKVSNPSGSAHLSESDEISHKFLIAVSSIDDSPEQRAYSVGNFIYPKILKFDEVTANEFIVVIEHGVITKRRTTKIHIKLRSVTINSVPYL